jgi:hypothetical protein
MDIVFKGKYLWSDNPKAVNLVYKYEDLVKGILKQEEQAKVAEAERLRIQREQDKEQLEQFRKQKEEWVKRSFCVKFAKIGIHNKKL